MGIANEEIVHYQGEGGGVGVMAKIMGVVVSEKFGLAGVLVTS